MRKKCAWIVIVIFFASSFWVCSNWYVRDEVNRSFTNEELLEDYDFLWETLEKEYLFLDVLEDQGIDINNIKETARRQVCEQNPDIVDFYRTLDSMFLQLNYFAHLQVVSTRGYEIYRQQYAGEQSPPSGWKNVLQNQQVQAAYTELLPETVFKDACYNAPEVEKSYDEKRKAVTFRIKSFDTELLARDEELLQNYLETFDDTAVEHIIFDITGNAGGNDAYWMENLVAPFGGNYNWTSWVYLRDTPLTRSYYFDSFSPKPIHEIDSGHSMPEFSQELGITHFIKMNNEYHWSPQLREEIVNAKRWVLIDRQVYSSAESFANFCKVTGWATLVGRRTRGDGIGMTPILVALPNTGLLIRFSAEVAENEAGQLDTLYGTAPDVVSGQYEAPQNTVRRLIDEWM